MTLAFLDKDILADLPHMHLTIRMLKFSVDESDCF